MAKNIKVESDGKVYLGRGFLNSGDRIGRVDATGEVYEGGGGLFRSEDMIGWVDSAGDIYRDGSFLRSEKKVGWVDADGNVYRSGGFLRSEKKIGRVSADGDIIKNGEGLFGFLGNKKVGKAEGVNRQLRGAAALLLLYSEEDTDD